MEGALDFNARPRKALVGRAQWGLTQATPEGEGVSGGTIRSWHAALRVKKEQPPRPSCSQTAHDQNMLGPCAQ